MAFGVFIHRADSIYNDSPAEQYQFPAQYLSRARACVGDWIIYYEPRKVPASRGYFAVAKVQQIIPDRSVPNMYCALIHPGSYLDFPSPVAFIGADGLVKSGLLNEHGRISGRAQAAVRSLSQSDFPRILDRGLTDEHLLLQRTEEHLTQGLEEQPQTPFQFDFATERSKVLVSRALRDRVFRRIVLRAYEDRCAVSGLKLINGGGRAEVSAAHIRPVEANGPDIIGNGIALSGTAHWMFDRGLISLTDDLNILISRQVNDFQSVRAFLNKDGRALQPRHGSERPHPHFLAWHRQNCFKQ